MKNMMTVEERIRRCLLIEKMERDKEYSTKLGLENKSIFYEAKKPETFKRHDDL